MLASVLSWDVAMRMRNKEAFATITEDLMADLTKTNEILQQPLTKKPRTGKGQGQQNTRYKGYQPKWSPPGKGRRYRTADGSPWQSWSSSSSPSTWQTWTPTSGPDTPAQLATGTSILGAVHGGNHSDDTYSDSLNPTPTFTPTPPWQHKGKDKGNKWQQRERKKGKGGKGGKK